MRGRPGITSCHHHLFHALNLLQRQGRTEEALRSAQEAYALASTHPEVVDTLGWIYLRSGLLDRSISFLEQAHRADPERPGPALHLAQAYGEAGRIEEARGLLAPLLEGEGARPETRSRASETLRSLPPPGFPP